MTKSNIRQNPRMESNDADNSWAQAARQASTDTSQLHSRNHSVSPSSRSSPSKPDNDRDRSFSAVRQMVHAWIISLVPAAVIAWNWTHRWPITLAAALATPMIVILQGSVGILTYRLFYGDAPVPLTPCHGVVVVNPQPMLPMKSTLQTQGLHPPGRLSLLEKDGIKFEKYHAVLGSTSFLQRASQEQPPIRLLVVGDSLAIGVGQGQSSTPVMPEVIAKTLSKRMGGRVVYWTCHGATGASAGWIVRELERGVDYLRSSESLEEDEYGGYVGETDDTDETDLEPLNRNEMQSSASETDDSSSDESAADNGKQGFVSSGSVRGDETMSRDRRATLKQWRERLKSHRKRFDPEFLGPYDIAVVLTGANDLKSAIFPFLLTGEDAEFRRQAKERGGSYAAELRRLLETLQSRMRMRLKEIRDSVEAATETVRGRVEDTIERIAPGSSSRLLQKRARSNTTEQISSTSASDIPTVPETTSEVSDHVREDMPLVVLPGMPASSLPIFQHIPLRWMAIPFVSMMDMHKRDIARSHPGQVLFVPAPEPRDIGWFVEESGELWVEKSEEEVVLALRDIKREDAIRIEDAMEKYYNRKGKSAYMNNPFKAAQTHLLGMPPASHLRAFSADGVHANDLGYDFWGRYIANAIFEEWSRRTNPVDES